MKTSQERLEALKQQYRDVFQAHATYYSFHPKHDRAQVEEVLDFMAQAYLIGFDHEVVICAAIRTPDGRIARGQRHPHCFAVLQGWEQGGSYVRVKAEEEQGFITSRNRFVGREEGLALQQAAGIPSANPTWNGQYHSRILMSEDLY